MRMPLWEVGYFLNHSEKKETVMYVGGDGIDGARKAAIEIAGVSSALIIRLKLVGLVENWPAEVLL